MKRFHVHVGVKDLESSVKFYSTLFGQGPTKQKEDYAKWMLEDPRINFAISTRSGTEGVDHLGIQVDGEVELDELTQRLKGAELAVYDEGEATCCYAESEKAWVTDPNGLAWETYRTMGDAELFHGASESEAPACCVPDEANARCCG